MADLKQFAEQLVNLTVKEVNELATILKDEYGIEPAAAAVVAAPAGIEWATASISFEDPNNGGVVFEANGNTFNLTSSGDVDLSTWGLGSDFNYAIYSAIDSVLMNITVNFNGMYNTGEIQDTVYLVESVNPVYSYTDIYEYVDVLSYNDVVLEIGVSPEVDPAIPAATTEVGQYGNSGIASHPQIAGDASGNIYVAYSAINENFFNGQEYLRHVYAVKSTDAGLSWSTEIGRASCRERVSSPV